MGAHSAVGVFDNSLYAHIYIYIMYTKRGLQIYMYMYIYIYAHVHTHVIFKHMYRFYKHHAMLQVPLCGPIAEKPRVVVIATTLVLKH